MMGGGAAIRVPISADGDPHMAEEQKFNPQRQLVLHVMLSLLVSVAVFVVVSWLVVIPQLAKHEKRIRDLEAVVSELQEAEMAESNAVPPPPEAAPPAPAPAVPAPAPAAEKR